jgi:hypothetical protein
LNLLCVQDPGRIAGEVPADELEVRPGSKARTEGPLVLIRTQGEDKDIDIARRNMVWVKVCCFSKSSILVTMSSSSVSKGVNSH